MIAAGLIGVKDMADRSCRLTFETRELENREFLSLRDVRNQQGWLVFSLNEVKEEDIPKQDAEVGTKTPSMRLRSVLYILYIQEKKDGLTDLVFDVWYSSKMENIIQIIKNKIK